MAEGVNLRALAKRWIPGGLHRPVARAETYCRRLMTWASAIHVVRGVGPADRRAIAVSLLRAPLTAARDLDRWQDPALTADAELDVRGVGRFRVRAHSDDFYHILPIRESAIIRCIRERLQPGAYFVDAGANIGFYAVIAARYVGPHGRIMAIEMMPETAQILRTHVARNELENVEVVERALSERDGERVSAHVAAGRFGQASIAGGGAGDLRVEVETATLGTLLAGVERISLIKMDLEGAEVPALRGARPILDRVDAVVFETHTRNDEASDILRKAGFHIRPIDRRNALAFRARSA